MAYVSKYTGEEIESKLDNSINKTGDFTSIGALDSIDETCFFSLNSDSPIIIGDGLEFYSATGVNYTIANGQAYQELVLTDSNHKIVRHCYNGIWEEWEHENPIMEIGTLYRTTKRYEGKPVYALLWDMGTLPVEANKTKTATFSGITNAKPIACHVLLENSSGEVYRYAPWFTSTGTMAVCHQVTATET